MRKQRKTFRHVLTISGIIIFWITPGMTSCERDEGFGGNSSISGKIITREYNRDMDVLLQEYEAADHNVYIVFGDNTTVGKEVETTPAGSFSFEYLTPGEYEVYFYSEDTSASQSTGEMIISSSISLGKNEDLDMGILYNYDLKDYNDGFATIKGRVLMINYLSTAIPPYTDDDIKDIVPAQDYEVYLIYNDHDGYDERIRTDYFGYFQFSDLIKGNYRIYTYTEDLIGGRYYNDNEQVIRYPQSEGTFKLALYRDVTVSEINQVVTIEDFYSEKE